MGKGFGAVLPIVVIRVIADLLVNRLLGIKIMLLIRCDLWHMR